VGERYYCAGMRGEKWESLATSAKGVETVAYLPLTGEEKSSRQTPMKKGEGGLGRGPGTDRKKKGRLQKHGKHPLNSSIRC